MQQMLCLREFFWGGRLNSCVEIYLQGGWLAYQVELTQTYFRNRTTSANGTSMDSVIVPEETEAAQSIPR
jgi:hypothetical protein